MQGIKTFLVEVKVFVEHVSNEGFVEASSSHLVPELGDELLTGSGKVPAKDTQFLLVWGPLLLAVVNGKERSRVDIIRILAAAGGLYKKETQDRTIINGLV